MISAVWAMLPVMMLVTVDAAPELPEWNARQHQGKGAARNAPADPTASGVVDFDRDVEPIFRARCNNCHGPERRQGRLRLDSLEALLAGGASGKVVIAGNSRDSLLLRRVLSTGDAPRMPLGDDPLSADQVGTIRAWIERGSFGAENASAGAASGARPVTVPQQTPGPPVFANNIRPILALRCYQCHGPDVQQNGLRLDSLASVLKGGASGKVIIPRDSRNSPLMRRLQGIDRPQMPYGAPPLSAPEIGNIRQWIDEGALGPDSSDPIVGARPVKHWAFVKPVSPEFPGVKDASWLRNPIDRFILARLEKEGLRPSPEASREILIRRLSLDLVGLPPSPQDVDAFLSDRSPDAYERLVDRLLASPHYGERWARPWLDLARYADSNGYEADHLRVAWPWRDWVIKALNDDMSFKEFTIEQIAGDMLSNPTLEQRVATGFHRNTLLNQEGGVDLEEARWNTLLDRVNTTASVWLGITIECAQCHNHKFDPFTQKDYYRFLAFFEGSEHGTMDLGHGDSWVDEPQLELPTREQAARSKELKAEIAKLESALKTDTPELQAAQAQWEIEMKRANQDWVSLHPTQFASLGGATLKLLDDHSILAGGKNPEADTYRIQARTDLARITGVRLELLNDPSLPRGGPGRDPEGNFVLTGFELAAATSDQSDAPKKVVFKEALADESQDGYDIASLLKKHTGWAIEASHTGGAYSRQAVLIPEAPFGFDGGTVLTIELKHNMRHASRNIGRWRLSVTSAADPAGIVRLPARLRPALDVPAVQRSEDQQEGIAAAFRSVTPALQPARDRLAELKKSLQDVGIVTALVMQERASFARPATYVRVRGSFHSPGEMVYADVPSVLGLLPKDQLANRLGLAHWLVDDSNPLTARVTVNRIWEQVFGRGIVETGENFGTQGAPPTHLELLDFLACEFMRQGWSMKKIIRLLVTSATYRQSSRVTPELEAQDPYNKLLARGPRFRVEAEMVRDITLAASGLLSPKIGGPSVFPYQPEGIWDRPYSEEKWVLSQGEDQYRRGLYTFIRRTVPYPSLVAFDAPSREFCTGRRSRTNTPIQALTTLNDPAFFGAAQAVARRIVTEAGPDPARRATYGFRLCVTRQPTPQELEAVIAFHDQQLESFKKDEQAARELVGEMKNPPLDTYDLAAWVEVSNVLLNSDEALSKE